MKNALLYHDETMSVNKNEICSHYLDLKIQCSVNSIFLSKRFLEVEMIQMDKIPGFSKTCFGLSRSRLDFF